MSTSSTAALEAEPEAAAPGSGTKTLTTARKVLEVIDAVAMRGRPVSVARVAETLGWTRGAAHQYLHTARESGWLAQDDEGRYRASYHLTILARAQSIGNDILHRVRPTMQDLAAGLGEPVSFAVEDNGGMYIIERVEAVGDFAQKFQMSISITDSASGMAYAAFATAARLDELRSRGVHLLGPDTYQKIRDEGYSIIRSHWRGSDVTAIAVPAMFGRECIGALSVIAPSGRMDSAAVQRIAAELKVAATSFRTKVS